MQFGRFPDGPLLVEHLDTMISFVFTGLFDARLDKFAELLPELFSLS